MSKDQKVANSLFKALLSFIDKELLCNSRANFDGVNSTWSVEVICVTERKDVAFDDICWCLLVNGERKLDCFKIT